MKYKLLKKLRARGRDQVHIHSVTKTNGTVTGMSYGHDGSGLYDGIFSFGDTKEDVLNRACRIYMKHNIEDIRKRYKKYSVKWKK